MTPDDVLDAVAAEYGVERAALIGRGRTWPLTPARRVAYFVLHEYGMPWAEISRVMGRAVSGDTANAAARANPYRVDRVRRRLEPIEESDRYRWWQHQLELVNKREANDDGC